LKVDFFPLASIKSIILRPQGSRHGRDFFSVNISLRAAMKKDPSEMELQHTCANNFKYFARDKIGLYIFWGIEG
jgi:hypothetical protein